MDPRTLDDAIELWAAHADPDNPTGPAVEVAAPDTFTAETLGVSMEVADALDVLRKVYTHLAMGDEGLPDGVAAFQYRHQLDVLARYEQDEGARYLPTAMLLSGTDFDGSDFQTSTGERLGMRVGRSVLDASDLLDVDAVLVDCSAMMATMELAGGAVLQSCVLVGADVTVDGGADLRNSDLRRATITAFGPLDLEGAVADGDTVLTVTHRTVTKDDQVVTERADPELGFVRVPNDGGSWTYTSATVAATTD